jgi:hypothetical protein
MFSGINVIVSRGNFNRPSRRDDFSPDTLSQSAALSVIMGVVALLFDVLPQHLRVGSIALAHCGSGKVPGSALDAGGGSDYIARLSSQV